MRAALVLALLTACHEPGAPDHEPSTSTGAGAGSGAGSSGEDTGTSGAVELDCDAVPVITYDTFGAGFLATYCNGCHGAQVLDRKGAPPDVVFETRADAASFADRILARRMPPAGTIPMPPAGGVTPDDDERLHIWLTCFR